MDAAHGLFDTHAHIMSADLRAYPPSAEGRASGAAPYPVEQLLAEMDEAGVAAACAVQRFHYYHDDNAYVLDAARPHRRRLAPVVMLNGDDEGAPAKLRAMAARQRIGALRLANTHPQRYDTAWMNAPAALRLWETAAELGLPVAIIFYIGQLPYNLPALAHIAERFPELDIIVDHLGVAHAPVAYLDVLSEGRPFPFVGAPDYGITPSLKELRAQRRVHFKLTGINLEYLAHRGVAAAPFVRRFVTEFGAERVMCGSDIGQTPWPYARIIAELRAAAALLDADERAALLHGTAQRLFGAALEP